MSINDGKGDWCLSKILRVDVCCFQRCNCTNCCKCNLTDQNKKCEFLRNVFLRNDFERWFNQKWVSIYCRVVFHQRREIFLSFWRAKTAITVVLYARIDGLMSLCFQRRGWQWLRRCFYFIDWLEREERAALN